MSFATKGRAQKVMIEHQRIVDAIASHDPEAAEKATVDHIEMAATNMLKNLGLSSEEDVHADSAALKRKRPLPYGKGLFSKYHYFSAGAPTGQTPAQAPQLMQVPSSITYLPSPAEIAETGHSASQAPQLMHSSEITYAITNPPPLPF